MRKSHLLYLAILLVPGAWGERAWAACGSGSTTITGAQISGQTNRQAIVQFSAPHANGAKVQVFTDAACTNVVEDTNPALWSGSNAANRSGSIVDGVLSNGAADGQSVQFVAGTLTGNRALTQNTQYWAEITNTADSSQVTVSFATAPMPLGNLFPEQPPFSTTRWDNRGYPNFALGPAGRNTLQTDPTTGLLVKRMTFAGDTYAQKYSVGDGTGAAPPFDTPIDNNNSCTNAANLASNFTVTNYPAAPSGSYASCPNDLSVWLPLPKIVPSGGGDWGAGNEGAYADTAGLDYINLFVFGSTSAGSTTLTICPTLTPTGPCYQGTSGKTVTLSSSTNAGFVVPCAGTCTSGSVPDPGFASWGFTSAPLRGDMVPTSSNVSVSGSTVTVISGNPFQPTWPSGALIYIAGSSSWGGTTCPNNRCTIASVLNSATLSIAQTCSSGCPTSGSPATAVSRIFGFKIVGSGTGGTVSLQVGYEYGNSPQWLIGEDAGQQHCNANAVTVTSDANGNPYPGFTRNGYLCWLQFDVLQHGTFYLFIPADQNGAPLGEVRPLGPSHSGTSYTYVWTSNGASITNPNFEFAGWDASIPNKGYATINYGPEDGLLISFLYDSTKPGCNPAYTNWSGAGAYPGFPAEELVYVDTCFTYTNLTNPISNDVVTQITTAYAAANPGFSLAAFNFGSVTYLNDYFYVLLVAAGGSGAASPALSMGGTFSADGTLTQVFDSWSTYPFRWGNIHGPLHSVGRWHSWTADFTYVGNAGFALEGPWQMAVTKINLAGYGSAPNWTTNTALDNGTTNQYACPAGLPAYLVALGATGNHCLEVEVASQPYSATPDPRAIYPGGKTEAQQFPCSFNSAYSCLQPLAAGDHFMDGADGMYGEGFIIATAPVSNGSAWDFWVVRGSGAWPNNLRNPYPTPASHVNGWTAYMEPLQLIGCTPFYADSTTAKHTWLEGFYGLCLSHGSDAQGLSSSNENVVFLNLNNFSALDTLYNVPIAGNAMPTWYTASNQGSTPAFPTFNGSTSAFNNGNLIQFYADLGNLSATPAQRQWGLTERHLNPGYGSGGEYLVGMGTSGYTLAAVGGTTQTYSLTDPYSNGPPDPKNLPFMAWAGRFLLKDYSGPASILPDAGYGMCYTLQAGECVSGSSAGTMYVSVPAAAGCTQGLLNQQTITCPAVVNAGSADAQMQQFFINGLDLSASKERMLGQTLTGAGRQWQFNGPKLTPDGGWYMFTCVYPDGLRTDVCLGQVPAGGPDSLNRTTFTQIPVSVGGQTGDTVRAEFFYQEWGGCTSRQEHCFTSSSASASNPYLFGFEPQAYTACGSGCQVQIPALSGRMVYYSIHRKNGSSETAGPLQLAVAP